MSEDTPQIEEKNDNPDPVIYECQKTLSPGEILILNEANTNVYGFYNINVISDIPVLISTSSGACNCNFKQLHASGIELPDLSIENYHQDKSANITVTLSDSNEGFNIPLI